MARAGMATSASNAASNEFLTMNAPGSPIPLARNASFSRSTRAHLECEVRSERKGERHHYREHRAPDTTHDRQPNRPRAGPGDRPSDAEQRERQKHVASAENKCHSAPERHERLDYVVRNVCRTQRETDCGAHTQSDANLGEPLTTHPYSCGTICQHDADVQRDETAPGALDAHRMANDADGEEREQEEDAKDCRTSTRGSTRMVVL